MVIESVLKVRLRSRLALASCLGVLEGKADGAARVGDELGRGGVGDGWSGLVGVSLEGDAEGDLTSWKQNSQYRDYYGSPLD